jgi:hypothetical protein
MRAELAEDEFMRVCIINDAMCAGRIEWNHAFKYAGIRRNELWGLLPMCSLHHSQEAKWRPLIEQVMRKRIKHFGAEEDFKAKYPKSTLLASAYA